MSTLRERCEKAAKEALLNPITCGPEDLNVRPRFECIADVMEQIAKAFAEDALRRSYDDEKVSKSMKEMYVKAFIEEAERGTP